jgi:enoyl-CoA hydratase/carnithine racemase
MKLEEKGGPLMIESETFRLEQPADGVLLMTLDRPDRLNAMTVKMFDEFEELAHRLRDGGGLRTLIMTGAGKAFCAGYDLDDADELAGLSPMGMLARQDKAARSLASLRGLPIPVIAALNGVAAGGGFALALAADIRIGTPNSRFNAAFVRIGLSAGDLGTSWYLPRLIGPGRAAEIAFTGRFVEAEEAERIGLLNRIVSAESLVDEALAMAKQIASNSPAGVQITKRALQANQDTPYSAALELESRGQALLTRSEDMPEALQAFKERREPNFTGR